jgi:hypothetical protein
MICMEKIEIFSHCRECQAWILLGRVDSDTQSFGSLEQDLRRGRLAYA